MSRSRQIRTICLVAAIGLARMALAASPDPAHLVDDGNKAFADEQYGEAEQHYTDAQRALPESPEVKFDLATARYKLGDLTGARELYLETLDSPAADETLRRRARYNLGNTAFKEAEQKLADGDLEGAVDAYRDSVRLYREAAGGDQRFDDQLAHDALWNIEVTRLRIKQILDEIKRQQEQQQQQEQKDRELRDKLNKAIEEQEQITEQTEQPEMTDEERDRLSEKQQENLERTKELSDELRERAEQNETNQSQPSGQNEAQENVRNAQEQLTESQTHQAESCEHMRQDDMGGAHESAEEALDDLKKARDELSKKREQPQPNQQQPKDCNCQEGQPGKTGEKEGREREQTRDEPRELTDQEAQRLLEEIKGNQAREHEQRARQLEREGFKLYDKKQHERVLRDW